MEEKVFEFIKNKKEVRTSDIIVGVKISRPTAIKFLKILETQGKITRFANGPKTFYTTSQEEKRLYNKGFSFWKIYKRNELKEDDVFAEVKFRFLKNLKIFNELENVLSYAFTEMLNNAIDHSQSARIKVEMGTEGNNLYFIVRDFGIGIFANLKNKLKLSSELKGAQEVTKGKITVDPEKHTGQGIFFTSRVADKFIIKSHFLEYLVENKKDNFVIIDLKKKTRGTEITFIIRKDASIHMTDIFRKYEDKNMSFSKTEIKVALFDKYAYLVSRSQAKMILSELDRFSKITFDFKGVDQIGQGFADEIFRVFQKAHPKIRLDFINANDNVSFMINRALKES